MKSSPLRFLSRTLSRAAWVARWNQWTRATQSTLEGARAGAVETPREPPPAATHARPGQEALEAEFQRRGLTYLHEVEYQPKALPAALNDLVRYDATGPEEFVVEELTPAPGYLARFSPSDLQGVLRRAMARPRPEVSIGPSPAGLGLFAAADIPAGTVIGLYVGEVRAQPQAVREPNGYLFGPPAFQRPNSYRQAARRFVIDASQKGNETRFINHSSAPKLDVVRTRQNGIWVPAFVANRAIAAGEELTFDYKASYWAGRDTPLVEL